MASIDSTSRTPIQAKVYSKTGNNWQWIDIQEGRDEGDPQFTISTHSEITDEGNNPVSLTFKLEDLPILIGYLTVCHRNMKKTELKDEIEYAIRDVHHYQQLME